MYLNLFAWFKLIAFIYSRLPNDIIKYQPEGKRNPGRPLKRLLDCYIETVAGHKAWVPESIMMMMFYLSPYILYTSSQQWLEVYRYILIDKYRHISIDLYRYNYGFIAHILI
jgi:hypothetical protein